MEGFMGEKVLPKELGLWFSFTNSLEINAAYYHENFMCIRLFGWFLLLFQLTLTFQYIIAGINIKQFVYLIIKHVLGLLIISRVIMS